MTHTRTGFMALHTAVPEICLTQEETAETFARAVTEKPRRQKAIKMIFDRTGVKQRYVVKPPEWLETERTTKERNDAYMETAIPLGERAITQGLAMYGHTPDEINEFYVVSCTGINVPGLDLHLAGRLGMPHSLRRTCILGMGCYGSFPALRRAYDAHQVRPDEKALVLSVELCSLHVQHSDDTENVISTGLFSDGAGMALIGSEAAPGLPYIVDSKVHSDYTTLDHMSFELSDTGFLMYLSSYVPDVLATHATAFVDDLLAKNGIARGDVKHWGIHPGSTKIVDYIQGQLGLRDDQVDVSHEVLAAYSNMSSATILFVLERICQTKQPQPGDYGVLMAFGPGLTIEALLLQW
ncbi:MAG: type III polyketide synthase [Chloroflexota bacterium]